MRPLAPYTPDKVMAEATRADRSRSAPQGLRRRGKAARESAAQASGHPDQPGVARPVRKYPETLLFGEDVAQKGGVYTVTKGLHKAFGNKRVFNTLLDETMILGLAQGYANMGMLPIPEIQYLAYFHNACDQIRGEAASLQFFSNDQYRNPMVVRIAGLGYQRGFGGHFHNDNSMTALRDIPGLVVGCPSRGDDAAMMLRTLMALAQGRRPRLRLPRADRAVHDQGSCTNPATASGLTRVPGARPGDGARRGTRLQRSRRHRSADLHLRQRRADEPARRARIEAASTAGRCAWSTCAGWCR
jgi:hypothetical protein